MKQVLLFFVSILPIVLSQQCPCGSSYCLLGARMWWTHDSGNQELRIDIQSAWLGNVPGVSFRSEIGEVVCTSSEDAILNLDATVTSVEQIQTVLGQATKIRTLSETARFAVHSGEEWECIWDNPGTRYNSIENANDCASYQLTVLVDLVEGNNDGPEPCSHEVDNDILWRNAFVMSFPCGGWRFDVCHSDESSPSVLSDWADPPLSSGVIRMPRIGGEAPTIITSQAGFKTTIGWDLESVAGESDQGDVYSLNYVTAEQSDDFEGTMNTDFLAVINSAEPMCVVTPENPSVPSGDSFEFIISVGNLEDVFPDFTDWSSITQIAGPGQPGFPVHGWTPFEASVPFDCGNYEGTDQDLVFEVCSSCGNCYCCGIVVECESGTDGSDPDNGGSGECHECSASTCAQLGIDDADAEGSSNVCAESNGIVGECSGLKTHTEAIDLCEDASMRLCTIDELINDETANTGCGYDRRLLWSSSSCSGGFMVGAGEDRDPVEECYDAVSGTAHVRCCADVNFNGCCEGPVSEPDIDSTPTETFVAPTHNPITDPDGPTPPEYMETAVIDLTQCPEVDDCRLAFLECEVKSEAVDDVAEFLVCMYQYVREMQLLELSSNDRAFLEPQTDFLNQMLTQFIREVDAGHDFISSDDSRRFRENLNESRALCYFQQIQCFMDELLNQSLRVKQRKAVISYLERLFCDIIDILPPGFTLPVGFKDLVLNLVKLLDM